MSRIKNLLFAIIGVLAGTLIALFLLELALGGWIFQDAWKATRSLNIIRNQTIHYSVESIYGRGAPKITYTRDRNGLRGRCEDPRRIDVLTVGGSTTDQRYITDGQTFQDQLAAQVQQKLGRELRVCNAGVDGHSTFGHIAAFEKWFPLIDGLHPQYVMLYIGINDAGFRLQPMPERDPEQVTGLRAKIAQAFREKSALYGLDQTLSAILHRGGENRYARHGAALPPEQDYVATATSSGIDELIAANVAGYSARLATILGDIRQMGARPICVTQPTRMWIGQGETLRGLSEAFRFNGVAYNGLDYRASLLALNKAMEQQCTDVGGVFIDVHAREFSPGDFYDPVHMTPVGASRLAGYLFEEMNRRELFTAAYAGR